MKLEKYKKNYISNFIISLDLENNLDESDYENILEMLSKNYPIKEKVDSLNNKNIKKENIKIIILKIKENYHYLKEEAMRILYYFLLITLK